MLFSVLTTLSATAPFALDMMVTREVRGAAYPVNRWNTQCSAQALNTTPCSCYGGASRRIATLNEAAPDVVKLDLGGYASGSGLFFPAFRGEAASSFLADSRYDSIALNYRDFTAGLNASEPTGGAWLASYLNTARTLDPSLPPAVVTNIDLTNDPYLTAATPTRANPNPPGHIAPWALIPMANNRTLAFLSLLDPQHLYPLSPSYANRIYGYERAIASALARLRRLDGGPPDALALAISDVPLGPLPHGFHDLLSRHNTDDALHAQTAELHAIVHEAIGVDVVMLGTWAPTTLPSSITNWAGDEVLLVNGGAGSSHGKYVHRVSTRLDGDGHLLRNASSVVHIQLNCSAPTDPNANANLHAYHERMAASLGQVRGYLQHPLDFPLRAAPRRQPADDEHSWGTCPRLGVEQDTIVCGCRVSECPQGAFAADALQWGGQADIGLVNGGSLRATLPSGATSEAELVQMLPFLNPVVRVDVSGATLRSALLHSVSRLGGASALSRPHGRMLQVSSSLLHEWYFADGVPVLGAVSFRRPSREMGSGAFDTSNNNAAVDDEFAPLDDAATYTIALTSYLAAGGDGFTMFRGLPTTPLSRTQVEITTEYLAHTAASPPGLPMPSDGRIVQKPAVMRLNLGILCAAASRGNTSRLDRREECDHVHHAIDMINDKSDGLFDNLLPNAIIVPREATAGCEDGRASGALDLLRSAMPTAMSAVIGPGCSGDVAALSRGRADLAFISGSSTASSLSNEMAYPAVARTVTDDAHTAKAVEALASLYSWNRVSVIHQDTMWAREAASGFIQQLKADNPDATILNEANTEFTHSVNSTVDPNALLTRLEASGARIVFLAAEPSAMRDLFAAVYRDDRLYGAGYAWLLAGIDDDVFRNDDGTVNTDAVHGAEGCLAFRERADTSTPTYTRYMQRWRARSSHAACGGTALHPYCNADNDPSTIAAYSAFYADAVLLYAHAMHAIFRSSDQTASALYTAIKRLAPFEGVGGRLLLDPASADRLGTLELLNMQIDANGGSRRRRRLAGFAASASRGALVSVGTYRTSSLNSTIDTGGLTVTGSIVFPGGVSTPPSDTPPPISLIVPLITVPVSLLIICGIVTAMLKFRAWRRLKREQEEVQRQKAEAARHMEEANRQRHEAELQRAEADLQAREAKVAKLEAEEAKRELSKFKDAMVGVRAVITAYRPPAASERASSASNLYPAPLSDGVASASTTRSASPTGGLYPNPTPPPPPPQERPRKRVAWYWQEDAERVKGHNASDVIERNHGYYVRYAWSVCRELERHYADQIDKPNGSETKTHRIDLDMRISSTPNEEKAYAQESGKVYDFDVAAMTQTNVKTNYGRSILRVEPEEEEVVVEEAPITAAPAPSEAMVKGFKSMVAKVGATLAFGDIKSSSGVTELEEVVVVDESKPLPSDLLGEDLLILEVGQLIQTNKMRADGWACGNVVLDVVDGQRVDSQVDGVSVQAGWFPLAHTALPNGDQLESLQSKMGAHAAEALRPPTHWSKVNDPMVAELVTLDDGREKQEVVNAFMLSLRGSRIQVVSVERIQNAAMWQTFAVKRQTVLQREKDTAAAARFERRWLFHGTDQDTVPKIMQQGFNRSFCGKNATAYGKGVYFARDSEYSSCTTYSRPNPAGVQHMFACRVVVGEYCQGVSNALAPSVRQGNILYDSTVDNVSNPCMYITYHDAQAYPEYLIKFRQ